MSRERGDHPDSILARVPRRCREFTRKGHRRTDGGSCFVSGQASADLMERGKADRSFGRTSGRIDSRNAEPQSASPYTSVRLTWAGLALFEFLSAHTSENESGVLRFSLLFGWVGLGLDRAQLKASHWIDMRSPRSSVAGSRWINCAIVTHTCAVLGPNRVRSFS